MRAESGTSYDEMVDSDGRIRSAYAEFHEWYDRQDRTWLTKQDAEAARLVNVGFHLALLNFPMRYVGGYLWIEGLSAQEAGHGWAEAYVAGLGWVGFDVSNAISPDERYVRVTTGCDYGEAAPVTGIVHGTGESRLQVGLCVRQRSVGQQEQQQQSLGEQSDMRAAPD